MCHPIAFNVTWSSHLSLLHHGGGRNQIDVGLKYAITFALYPSGLQITLNTIHYSLLLGCPF